MRVVPLLLLVACESGSLDVNKDAAAVDDTAPDGDDDDDDDEDTDDEDVNGVVDGTPCSVSGRTLTCEHQTVELLGREVHFQLPIGDPPQDGWPVAILFQGSLFSAELFWEAHEIGAFGAYNQALVVQSLLESGYAVVAPEARIDGSTFWDTNIPPFSTNWEISPDHDLMLAIFDGIESGGLGHVDADRLYASGISSGGYMSSRMAVAYPGRFRALAIHSASYATCSGALCVVPKNLPSDHPPTLFLHGEFDVVVPISSMRKYKRKLDDLGMITHEVTDPTAGHEWIDASVDSVVPWFDSFP